MVDVVWSPSGGQWLIVIAAAIVVYELLRLAVVGGIKRRYERNVQQFLREHDIPDDPFRHTHRVVVKERVLDDAGLREAMVERARRDGRAFHDVELQVRRWLDEIVPQFNLLAYYKVGYRIGRIIAYSTYHVRLDKESLAEAQSKIPEGAAVVYVSNHRSNADFVVTGFMLSKSVQISYAVGEWARVWPLESIFKAFGSYFVRRGEKDELYHRTLQAYLQLITKQGVTQAMFPEGGLTRDGALRPVKLGLLDYMAQCKLDPDFARPLVFIPVGINFDRVIEDENMVAEARGEERHRRTVAQKFMRLTVGLPRLVIVGAINLGRFMAKRLKKHGVAAIHFGEPLVFDEWQAALRPDLAEPDRHKRQEQLRPFGEALLTAIGNVIPATPVTLVCAAAARIGRQRMADGVDAGAFRIVMRDVYEELKAKGTPLALEDPYAKGERQAYRRQETADMSEDLDEADTLERALDLALDVTTKRRLLYLDDGVLRSQRFDLVHYYANSLANVRPVVQVKL